MKLNDKTKLVAVRLTNKQYEELEKLATKLNISISEVIRQFIDNGLYETNDSEKAIVKEIVNYLLESVGEKYGRIEN
jgi:predicted DNA-binding protein